MLADYQLLTREQLICGSQVHVDVADLDEACLVAEHVAPDLPPLLALSAVIYALVPRLRSRVGWVAAPGLATHCKTSSRVFPVSAAAWK